GPLAPLAAAVPDQLYSHGEPTAEEQFMLELINRARANPTAEAARLGIDLNEGIETDLISPAPKQALAFNVKLIQSARGHSQWMLDNDAVTHVETGGIDPADRMRAAGYVFNRAYALGENIAFRYTSEASLPVAPTVALLHDGLFIDHDVEHRG